MKLKTTGLVLTALGLGFSSNVSATNGVNMIGIGPNSRSLGGTGLAAPQDAVSAVFANPAAMCISEACGSPQFDFSLTTFIPQASAKMATPGPTFSGDSASDLYFIPALGVSLPIGGEGTRWRVGFALYGISGLGVDYENEPIGGVVPINFTELQIMKIAPSIAYSITPDISVGMSVHANYASLEIGGAHPLIGKNDATDWSYGLQLGATWKMSECLTAGISYTTAQKNTFDGVMPVFGMAGPTGAHRNFDLEAPQQAGLGLAWIGVDDRLTLSCDVKWFNWSEAAGYSDFGWEDQWTFGVGAQYELIQDKLVVRVGYNYGKNPLRKNPPANGGFNADVMSIIAFPAIVEHHAALGFGYQINEDLILNVAWVHAFENTMRSSNNAGTSVESSLSEDTFDIALSWRF